MPAVFGRASLGPHASLVLSRKGFAARIWSTPTDKQGIAVVSEVGRSLRRYGKDTPAQEDEFLFDRSVRAFGLSGQRLLGELTVAVVGAGGTGSIVLEQLAYLGVNKIILLDPDVIEATNLNRVVGATLDDIGKPKVDAAADHVRRIRPEAVVTSIRGSAVDQKDARLLLTADLIFCCTDSHGSRAVINQIAYQYYIPALDLGVRIESRDGRIGEITGRTQMLSPGLPCLICQNLLDPEEVRRDLLSSEERARDPYIVGTAIPQPAVVSINGVVASLAVTMFLSATVGIPMATRHQVYLADRGIVRSVESNPLDECIVCSSSGALGKGDAMQLPWRRA